ncbi:MAG TPA: hypothetical protein VFG68_06900 [Fimbriiglobus sp.]|nr:hypothetical protein [Fimbriiglobus sp.]
MELPIRWTVVRTFAWQSKCRRLTKDREKSVRSSEAFVKLAMRSNNARAGAGTTRAEVNLPGESILLGVA